MGRLDGSLFLSEGSVSALDGAPRLRYGPHVVMTGMITSFRRYSIPDA